MTKKTGCLEDLADLLDDKEFKVLCLALGMNCEDGRSPNPKWMDTAIRRKAYAALHGRIKEVEALSEELGLKEAAFQHRITPVPAPEPVEAA